MKSIKTALISLTLLFTGMMLSGCENTSVSGSVSYGMGMGYGYPMYYAPRGHHHTNIVVVKPPRKERSRPSKPRSRPSRSKRR